MTFGTSPMYCMGCHQPVCHGDCLAKHRDRYTCHNPQCVYHAPSPLRPEPGSEPAEGNDPDSTQSPGITTTTTENTEGNLVFRETITREWRLVNGQLAQVPGQSISLTPAATTRTSTGTQTAVSWDGSGQGDTATPNTNSTGGVVENPFPDDITDEEIQAQAQLWAQFRPPQPGTNTVPNRPPTPS